MQTEPCTHQHAVQFYENDDFLCDAVSSFVADGLAAVQPIIIISTAAHRAGISARLSHYGYSFDRVLATGQLMDLDASATLELFMRNGMPDSDLFASSVGRIVGERLQAHRSTSVRAYGEMVDVLWRAGNAAGALRLEELWNELADQYSFSLLCAYSIANFYKISDADYFDRICATHTRVIPTESITSLPDSDAQARRVTMLQQRSIALTSELEKAHRAKSDFLAVMSHELRTPLNAILGYDDLLEQEVGGPTTDEQKLYIGRIRNGAQQLMHMIDQVLALSRIETGNEPLNLEVTDVAGAIEEAVERVRPVADARGLLIETVLLNERVVCSTDSSKLRQILMSLMSNAVKFTPAGRITITAGVNDGVISIDIADTGVGIHASDLVRIFDRFVQVDPTATRRYGGTGAGLAISQDFARALGGDIKVTSEPGFGSVFTVQLPVHAPGNASARIDDHVAVRGITHNSSVQTSVDGRGIAASG